MDSRISEKALAARSAAKMFGGRALAGTKKQKEWAEKIRAEKIAKMSLEQAIAVCDPRGLLTEAKWWIEHRDRSSADIAAFTLRRKSLLAEAEMARAELRHDDYARIAKQYNDLTAEWGF